MQDISKKWQVYLLECSDRTYYCGISNRFVKRLTDHIGSKGAKYTRGRGPFKVLAITGFVTKSHALRIEAMIKSLKRSNKVVALLEIALDMKRRK